MGRKSGQTSAPTEKNGGCPTIVYSLEEGSRIYVKTADLCRALGKTASRVSQLTKDGVLHKSDTSYGSLYELFSNVAAFIEKYDSRFKKCDDDKDKAEIDKVEMRRKQADAKLKEAKAAIEELKADELRGKMHRSEDVQKMTADLLYYVRGSLMALAGRCATACAASSEPAQVQKIIESEVFAILTELTSYRYDEARYDELVRQRMKREAPDAVVDVDTENDGSPPENHA